MESIESLGSNDHRSIEWVSDVQKRKIVGTSARHLKKDPRLGFLGAIGCEMTEAEVV